jgi:type I restriction enzyme S subunit
MTQAGEMDKLDTDGPTPTLRFPGFDEGGAWQREALHRIASSVKDKATGGGNEEALTLSGEKGLIPQDDYFGKQISGDNVSRYIKIVRDDFVYNDRTTKASKFGSIKRLTSTDGGIVSPIYKCFRFMDGQNPDFWGYYFEAQAHQAQLGGLVNEGARAGRFNISIDKFLSIDVWKPSSAEQEQIAECFASIDTLIEAETEKLDALKDHKQGLIQRLFPVAGENLPPLRFSHQDSLAGWQYWPLGTIVENFSSRRVPVAKSKRIPGNIPYYGASGIVDYVSDYLFDEDLLCVSEDGANLVARSTPIAFAISGKTWVNNHAHVLKPKSLVIQKIIETYLNFISLQDFITGMAQPKLNKAKLESIPIPLPDDDGEQDKLSALFTTIDEILLAQQQKVDGLYLDKLGLLQQLFPVINEVQG